jgi:hypothetical protein
MRPALWWTCWWAAMGLCLAPALATFQSRDSNYNVAIATGGGGGFTGQGDIVAAVAWSGLRAYSAATRGTKVANVCNPTDAVGADCTDWFSDASTGDLVATTINGANCTSVTCDVKVLYDQTGNTNCTTGVSVPCDYTQTTKALRPTLVSSCVTTKWCMSYNGTSAYFESHEGGSTSNITLSQPITLSYVFFHTNVGRQDISPYAGVNFGSTANEAYGSFGNFTPITGITSFDSNWNVMHVVGNGVSGDVHINSTTNTNDLGSGAFSANVMYCGRNANFFAGKIVECGIWGSAVSAANMNTMSANAHTYWGF